MSDCDSALTFWSAILSIRVFTGADFLRVSTVPLLILCNSSCVDNCGYSNIQHAMHRLYVYVYNKYDHTTKNRNPGITILWDKNTWCTYPYLLIWILVILYNQFFYRCSISYFMICFGICCSCPCYRTRAIQRLSQLYNNLFQLNWSVEQNLLVSFPSQVYLRTWCIERASTHNIKKGWMDGLGLKKGVKCLLTFLWASLEAAFIDTVCVWLSVSAALFIWLDLCFFMYLESAGRGDGLLSLSLPAAVISVLLLT